MQAFRTVADSHCVRASLSELSNAYAMHNAFAHFSTHIGSFGTTLPSRPAGFQHIIIQRLLGLASLSRSHLGPPSFLSATLATLAH